MELFFLRGRISAKTVSTVNWRGKRFLVRGVKGFENLESLRFGFF